jgi:adenylate cyclase, class 2
MQSVEIEVKFRVANHNALEAQLRRLGFHCDTPRTFERNILFDTPARDLRNTRQILRLRSYDGKWVVTHKQTLPDDSPLARHKQRIETESRVEDGAALERIFAALGYQPAFVYEKWRSEWSDAEGHCVIDETPIGLYAELEGPPAWIDATLDRLQVHSTDVTTLSYGRLFEVWQQETGSKAANMAFAEITASK